MEARERVMGPTETVDSRSSPVFSPVVVDVRSRQIDDIECVFLSFFLVRQVHRSVDEVIVTKLEDCLSTLATKEQCCLTLVFEARTDSASVQRGNLLVKSRDCIIGCLRANRCSLLRLLPLLLLLMLNAGDP